MSSKITKLATKPLSLLRQIRDVMAGATSAQNRLDNVVKIIAEGFESEVCSVYLLRAGDVLELFASVGLNENSLHLTSLSIGQGLVGSVAASTKPLDALALIGVGVRSVSVSSAAIGQIKAMVRSINIEQLSEYMDYLLTLPTPSIRQWLADFARDHEIRV